MSAPNHWRRAEGRQRKSLLEIEDEAKRLKRLQKRLSDGVDRLVETYRAVHQALAEFIEEHLNGGRMEIAGDVTLTASADFDAAAFSEQVMEGLDGRQRLDALPNFDHTGYRYPGIDQHCENLASILRDLTAQEGDRSLKLKKSYTASDVAASLVRDRFRLRLSLLHDGDDLQRMSPGKRGMVLLRLLLEKSDATHPILIDQPEDNLDNRTVFSQLREGVRQRKVQRQIVLVTHNANLVVSTDAECVIVAHQYGPGEQPAEGTQFEYRGGALEHSAPRVDGPSVLRSQGTREHVCEILEGGEEAFINRQQKYEFQPG